MKIRVYVTKYALTSGIRYVLADVANTPRMISYGRGEYAHGEGKDWHRTWDAALDRAMEMRNNKIVSLRKSVSKMENLTFTRPT